MDSMYYGDVLVVDLKTGKTETLPFEPETAQQWGPGLGAALALFKEHEKGDPLVVGSGLLTGTIAPAACLGFVLGKSPLTRQPAVSPLTLFAGAEVKLSGFSMIVIKGESTKPVYLWLHDGVADILDASSLRGMDTWQTTDAIRADMGEQLIQVISIGPAGEKKSKLASFSINYWGSSDSSALGALMGSKNLKAVAVRGLGMIDADDPQAFYKKTKELLRKAPGWRGFNKVLKTVQAGDVDNWLKPIVHRHRSCFACPSACATFVKYNESPQIMGSDGGEEPGMLVTSAAAALWLMDGGWDVEPSCRAMEELARRGIDQVRGARELAKTSLEDTSEISKAVEGLKGEEVAGWPSGGGASSSFFGSWVPPVASEKEWTYANQAGYVLGICPIYILAAGIKVERLLELCAPAARMDLEAGRIADMLA